MSNGPTLTVGSTQPTPQQIALQQQFGQGLLQSGFNSRARTAPQGIASVLQAGLGALMMHRANQQQQARQQAANNALLALFGGSGGGSAPSLAGQVMSGPTGSRPLPGALQAASAGGVGPGGVPGVQVAPGGAGPGGGGIGPGGPGAGIGPTGLPRSGPGIAALLQTATAFPSLAPVLSPLIASQLKGPQGFTGVAAPGSQVFQGGQLVAKVPAAQKEPKIVEVQDPNDPTRTMFVTPSQALAGNFAGVPRSNFTVETITDPSTGQTRTILTRGSGAGASGGSGLQKSTMGKLEQGITQATTQLDRLKQIRQGFNTRFLELPEQLRQKGLGALEKLGFDVGPENRAQMRQFTRFASSATRNLNRLLNELSGAAVSPAEAKRLTAELPTLKDSPSQFLAKMEDAEASIAAAVRRNQELLARGVENLEFNARGEVSNAPDLDTFMLLEDPQPQEVGSETTITTPQGSIQTSTVGAQGQPNQVLQFDSQGNPVQ